MTAGFVFDGDRSVVRQAGLRTNGGIFGKACADGVTGKLVGPGLKLRQSRRNTGFGMFDGVSGHPFTPKTSFLTEPHATIMAGVPVQEKSPGQLHAVTASV